MTEPTTPQAGDSGYAPVNGLQMYYEVHGSGGRPLVLLHGNLSTIGVDFGGVIPSVAKGRQVIGVEQQAHGHTADIDRPLSIRHWADDTDIVQPEHTVEMFRLLGGGVAGDLAGLPRSRLAVLPGTTDITLVQRADWLSSMVGEFLDAECK
jgi:hypothetical protein